MLEELRVLLLPPLFPGHKNKLIPKILSNHNDQVLLINNVVIFHYCQNSVHIKINLQNC